ncbi:winged helix-turn-helix domain-containing protein [Enterococcus faecalis]|uniref:winged helix-turn-helix domain-containing protein n=1 Tax=Enterococcus faecalis TaxID=1351 RepID=UPI000C31B5E9|nr:winged helix-turn-helix domain-containing protein [Enterococcus faecalis]EGO2734871.1 response regulator [Enterococcus faecalis]EGO6639730.1 response regulator [Enterococcus faecalis]EGO8005177.1 response regulator [Enterococcus faecalis]EGO8300620.1 response regulator [Enterococcus faecalis]EGO8334047.1 response regulator [Enterococcus faecalis]
MKVNIICIGNNLNSIYKDEIEEYFAESNHYSEKELKNIKPNKEEIYLIYHSNEVENDLKYEVIIALCKNFKVPIFVLSDCLSCSEQIIYLNLGVMGFLTTKFTPANIKTILANNYSFFQELNQQTEAIEAPLNFQINSQERSLRIGDSKQVQLTRLEFKFFNSLYHKKGHVVNYEEIAKNIWEKETFEKKDTVRLSIIAKHVREKLREIAGNSDYIYTMRSIGYKFKESC